MADEEFAQFVKGQFKAGDAFAASDYLVPLGAIDVSDNMQALTISTAGGLKVDIIDASGITVDVDVFQYQDGDANTSAYGNVMLGDDGTNLQFVKVDSNGVLAIQDNGGSLTVDGTVSAQQNGVWDVGTVGRITQDVNIADGGNSITIDGTATVAATHEGAWTATVSQSGAWSATVSATDLDIRNLTGTTDKVQITDGTDALAVNTDGSINVITPDTTPSTMDYGTVTLVKDTEGVVNNFSPAINDTKMKRVVVSGEGKCLWTVYVGATGDETDTPYAAIHTSPGNENGTIELHNVEVASTDYITITGTNMEQKASPNSDFVGYATIIKE